MKRPLIITIGIVIILLVLGVWVYLLLFGTPSESDDVFTNLGFDITPRDVTIVDAPEDDGYNVDVSSGLQQLTTRPVAGFVSVSTASSSVVRYVEQGTGHIYEIDLFSGREQLVSRTTLPRVREAAFSDDGTRVALTSVDAASNNLFVGVIDAENQSLADGSWESLVPNIDNMDFLGNNEVVYTVNQADSQVGYAYNMNEGGADGFVEQFRIPFQDTQVVWRDTETLVYNSPAETLLGYLYEIRSGSFQSTDILGFSLVAEVGDQYVGYQTHEDDVNISKFIDRDDQTELMSPIQLVPEKCDFSSTDPNTLWCADQLVVESVVPTTDWYQGKTQANDALWAVDVAAESATLLINLQDVAGRPLDVTHLTVAEQETLLLFVNKFDNTLWKFDI